MYNEMRVLDCHIHYALPTAADSLVEIMDATGTDMANLVIVPNRQRVSSVPDALRVKAQYPDRFFVFASLDVSAYFRAAGKVGKAMQKYAQQMLKCGCDGIKIIEGKPNMRRDLPVPDFDDPQWEPFFAWAEAEQVPILWHVNDPETFWHPELAPSWAKKQGWSYDESYINNEVQYQQILNLLERHPRLKIIFAHFFFLSAQLPRLSQILDRFPNIMVDTTPGIELYENLSANPEGAKEFFRKYAHRVTYGTDIGARSVLPGTPPKLNRTECINRANLAQTYLTASEPVRVKADGDFLVGEEDFDLMGLGLSQEAAQKILADNFLNFVGGNPVPVVPRQVLRYLRNQKILIRVMSMIDRTVKPDMTIVNENAAFFRAQHK